MTRVLPQDITPIFGSFFIIVFSLHHSPVLGFRWSLPLLALPYSHSRIEGLVGLVLYYLYAFQLAGCSTCLHRTPAYTHSTTVYTPMHDPVWTRAIAWRLRPPKYERIKAIITASAIAGQKYIDDEEEDPMNSSRKLVLAVVVNDESGKETGGCALHRTLQTYLLSDGVHVPW